VIPDAPAVASATADTTLSEAQLGKRYRVIETITPGLEDALYLARCVDTGALAELRVLSGRLGRDRVLVAALVQQATLVARISGQCPGIATVLECERTKSGLTLAMERPEGPTLREVIKREGTLDRRRALVLAKRLGEVLEGVHNLGLVHSGLRPENIVLVGPEERVVLKHFGFDWVLQSRSPDTAASGEAAAEEPVYRAPEQAWEESTHRSDMYAFGAILYEMLAGVPASAKMSSSPRAYRPLGNYRADVTPGLERIVAHALQVAPERRPADISFVCNALAVEFAAEDRPALSESRTPRGSRPRWTMSMLGWGVAIALTLGVLWFAGTRVNIDWSSLKPALPRALNFVRTPAPAERAGPGAPSGTVETPSAPPDTSGAARQGADDTLVTHGKSDRASQARDSQKARASRQSLAPPVAPVKPIESEIRGPGTSGETAVTKSEVSTMVPRHDAPDPAPPQTVRDSRDDAGNDPGAIIDWLLNEGASKER
jgi:serine/threonine protein kinase